METILCNLGESRRETLNGRDYLVAPATLIVGDRVLNGSDGPGMYPAEDVTANVEAWDGMPLVVRHPTDSQGNNISARQPQVVNAWGIGNVWNNKAEGGNHVAEAWFDIASVKAVDQKLVKNGSRPIWPMLEYGKQIELSTGLRPRKERANGVTANGQEYVWIARQPYNPDHVAVFPPGEERGACSVKDGCGVNNLGNAWSDAAREAAAAARRASSSAVASGASEDHATARDAHSNAAKLFGDKAVQAERMGKVKVALEYKKHEQDHLNAHSFHVMQVKPTGNEKRTLWQKLGAMLGLTNESGYATRSLNESTLPAQANDPTASTCPKCGAAMTMNAKSGQMTCSACGYKEQSPTDNGPSLPLSRNDHLPWDECIAKGLKEYGSQKQAEELCGAIKAGTANQTTNQENSMPLTKTQREQVIRDLTTNCACKIKPKVLNELDDDELTEVHNGAKLTLVVNSYRTGSLGQTRNAEGEGEAVPGVPWPQLAKTLGIDIDPRTDPVGFTGAMKKALDSASTKLGGASPPAPPTTAAGMDAEDAMDGGADESQEDSQGNKVMGNKQRIAEKDLPADVREDLAFARQVRNQRKEQVVRELISDVVTANRKEVGDYLWKKPLAELELLLKTRPAQQVQNQRVSAPDWSMAGGGQPTVNADDQAAADEVVEMMTMNCGVGQQPERKTA